MKKLFLPAILLLAVVGWAQSPANDKPKQSKFETEFNRLINEFTKANQQYFAPYQKAKTDEESNKIKLDPAKEPGKLFAPKFMALAKKAGKSDVAARAWMQVFSMARADQKTQVLAFDKLVTHFPDSSVMPQLASMLAYSFYELGDKRVPKINSCLARIDKATKTDSVKAAVLYTRSNLIGKGGRGDTRAAQALLEELLAKYPNTSQAKSASADIFELKNLSVGCPAPDFEASDENGVTFKLSDYRGKVVLLDFWGFW